MAPLQYAPTMAPMHHAPTMAPLPNYFSPTASGVPTPQQDAETIHRACKGIGTNEKAVISVVVYKQFYGKDLVEVLDKETSGNFGKTLHYLILPPIHLDAELLYDAIVGPGTNERCLIHVLLGRTNADMAALKNLYFAKYHKALESDVKSDVSGYLEKLFMVSIQ
ncbi:Annexin A11, partial [Modicella reniformis]